MYKDPEMFDEIRDGSTEASLSQVKMPKGKEDNQVQRRSQNCKLDRVWHIQEKAESV